MKIAAAQILSAKTRIADRLNHDPVRRNEHFKKYNIAASTYDPKYCKAYGEEYLSYLDEQVKVAADAGADLLLMPEFLFTPGVLAPVHPTIPVNENRIADAMKLYMWSGKVFKEWLCRKSKETGMLIGAASFMIRRGKIYNTGLLADEKGEIVLRYEKVHLPYDEKKAVGLGKDYTVADTRLGRIGFAICYDMQFPEHLACLAMQGAQIILHPSGGYALPDEGPGMGLMRLRVRATDHFAAIVYSAFAKEGCRDSAVIAPNGDVKAIVEGDVVGFAVGEVTIPTKRSWPGEAPDSPDWDKVRRALRRPETYRTLAKADPTGIEI